MLQCVHNELIKISTHWVDVNFQEITKGLNMSAGKELLDLECNLMLLVIQVGGLVINLVLKTRIENLNLQKEA